MTKATCKSCGATIVWLPTQKGAWMPVDSEGVAVDDDVYMPTLHTSHFNTCPNADKHSKTNKTKS